ncbi:MAG: PmbA/TldA family metallopeptidase, partial [Alphaproteobacteria bacterium]
MDPTEATDRIFFEETDLTKNVARQRLAEGLDGADDGELYLEHRTSEALTFDDGQLRAATHNIDQGFGMRAVAGEFAAYAHGAELSDSALARAAETAREAGKGRGGDMADGPSPANRSLYG